MDLLSDLFDHEDSKMIKITEDFYVFHEIYNKLYPYQREGVAWMWKLYKIGKGGVLGDDTGLGKTFQIIAFLSGMVDAELVKHVLIIMPKSLLKTWEKEFTTWCPSLSVLDFHSNSKRNILQVQQKGNVLLTSYGMVLNHVTSFSEMDGREFVWDYVILDEGHKITNPTKTTEAVYKIPTLRRFVVTGRAIQNNLKELWSLYDFTHHGSLLGSLKTFKMQYEAPITWSREKDATAGEKRLGSEMAENLMAVIKPYFLRRTKDEIWGKNGEDVDHLEQQMENMKVAERSVKKNELILWTYMSPSQITIYKNFLDSDAAKAASCSKKSPLPELTTLKNICDHPRLLRHWKVMTLDGTITKPAERERRIQRFQNDSSYPVFLLTTQVGGVGLTLTAADRVIIYSPNRNPAIDAQAIDRVYRIGQEKDVLVYRLITCGTVEEELYRRQIFKDSITGILDDYRYFLKEKLQNLPSPENPHESSTQMQLYEMQVHEMQSSLRHTYGELDTHIEFLKTLPIFSISDHDLMCSKVQDNSEDNAAGAISNQFIKQKAPVVSFLKNRKSCGARTSATFVSESDASQPNSASCSISMDNPMDDDEDPINDDEDTINEVLCSTM